jgi:hypothetical protein
VDPSFRRRLARRPNRARSLLAVLSTVMSFVACAEPLDARLMTVESVEPTELEPGDLAIIRGAGFAAGDDASVRLMGTMRAPGGVETDVRLEVEASAVSASELALVITDELVDRAGGRGTFDGDLEISFALDRGGVVTGRLEGVRLDFVPSENAETIDRSLARTRAAEGFLERAGIIVSPDDADESPGFRIDAVLRGSAAARAGLAKGDRIIEVDGVRVLAFGDLVPMGDASHPRMAVLRPGRSTPILADLDLAASERRALPAALVAAIAFVFIVFLGTLTPVGRVVRHLAPSLARLRRGLPSLVAHAQKRSGSRFDRARMIGLAIASVIASTLAFLALPFAASVLGASLHVAFIALVIVLCRWLAPPSRELPRSTRIATAASELLAIAVLAGCASIATDGSTLFERVIGQGATPWEWSAFRDPCLFLAVIALFSTQMMSADRRSGSPWREIPATVARLVAAALLASVCFGGWNVPGFAGNTLEAEPWLRALGLGVYLAKCWAMLLLPLGYPVRSGSPALTALLSIAAFAGAVLFALLPGTESIRAGLGIALLGASVVVVIGALAARRIESKLVLASEPLNRDGA